MNKKRAVLTLAACLILSWSFFSATAQTPALARPPYSSDKPLREPTIFAEGVISIGEYDSHPEFTPDGKTLYFLKSTPSFDFWTIVVSHFNNGKWGAPEIAPFSGQYSDADPFITRDGSKLYFISNRPVNGQPRDDMDIWMMEKTGTGWGEPQNLGAPINSTGNEWFPTLASDGTLYFGSNREGGIGATDIYRAKLVGGKYTEAVNLGDSINTRFNEFECFIAPDESFLIMAGDGRFGGLDLHVSFNHSGVWTKARNLGEKFNSSATEFSPKVSPDGKYFFFTSTRGFAIKPLEKRLTYLELSTRLRGTRNGLGDIYQIDIGELGLRR